MPASTDPNTAADFILSDLDADPEVAERLIRRVAILCGRRKFAEERLAAASKDDALAASAAVNAWAECYDLFSDIARTLRERSAESASLVQVEDRP